MIISINKIKNTLQIIRNPVLKLHFNMNIKTKKWMINLNKCRKHLAANLKTVIN